MTSPQPIQHKTKRRLGTTIAVLQIAAVQLATRSKVP